MKQQNYLSHHKGTIQLVVMSVIEEAEETGVSVTEIDAIISRRGLSIGVPAVRYAVMWLQRTGLAEKCGTVDAPAGCVGRRFNLYRATSEGIRYVHIVTRLMGFMK